jgi:hypothetical protein
MGFTALEGLVMGTRSGDIDPTVMSYLVRKEGVPVEEVETWLNTRSGMRGVSGVSNDMRELLAQAEHNERARLAIELFCYLPESTSAPTWLCLEAPTPWSLAAGSANTRRSYAPRSVTRCSGAVWSSMLSATPRCRQPRGESLVLRRACTCTSFRVTRKLLLPMTQLSYSKMSDPRRRLSVEHAPPERHGRPRTRQPVHEWCGAM